MTSGTLGSYLRKAARISLLLPTELIWTAIGYYRVKDFDLNLERLKYEDPIRYDEILDEARDYDHDEGTTDESLDRLES